MPCCQLEIAHSAPSVPVWEFTASRGKSRCFESLLENSEKSGEWDFAHPRKKNFYAQLSLRREIRQLQPVTESVGALMSFMRDTPHLSRNSTRCPRYTSRSLPVRWFVRLASLGCSERLTQAFSDPSKVVVLCTRDERQASSVEERPWERPWDTPHHEPVHCPLQIPVRRGVFQLGLSEMLCK